jgi:hypothetical protein
MHRHGEALQIIVVGRPSGPRPGECVARLAFVADVF